MFRGIEAFPIIVPRAPEYMLPTEAELEAEPKNPWVSLEYKFSGDLKEFFIHKSVPQYFPNVLTPYAINMVLNKTHEFYASIEYKHPVHGPEFVIQGLLKNLYVMKDEKSLSQIWDYAAWLDEKLYYENYSTGYANHPGFYTQLVLTEILRNVNTNMAEVSYEWVQWVYVNFSTIVGTFTEVEAKPNGGLLFPYRPSREVFLAYKELAMLSLKYGLVSKALSYDFSNMPADWVANILDPSEEEQKNWTNASLHSLYEDLSAF